MCVTSKSNFGKEIRIFYLPALQQGSGSHKVMSGKDEATSGQSHCSAGVSLNFFYKILLKAGFYLMIISQTGKFNMHLIYHLTCA